MTLTRPGGDTVADLPMADRHETVLPEAPADVSAALDDAAGAADPKAAVARVVGEHPTSLRGWATLAQLADDPVERYAYARVGYHRGLDALRANGWGGRGFVRWSEPTNRPFLTCLVRLRDAALGIGEAAEVDRIDGFLRELDPDWDDANA